MGNTTSSELTVLRLLARAKPMQFITDATGFPRAEVERIGRAHGWPDDMARLSREVEQLGEEHPESADHPSGPGRTELLLARADKCTTGPGHKAIERAAAKLRSAITALQQALTEHEAANREAAEKAAEAAKLRDKLARLEKEAAETRKLLRGTTGARASATAGTSSKDVRAWAAANGVECPTHGRVPRSVVEQYEAAHAVAA